MIGQGGSAASDGTFRLYSRWDYDWFRIEPRLLDFYFLSRVSSKTGDRTLFLVEAAQAGIFTIRGVPAEHLQTVLAVHCPTVLFPYLREALADGRGLPGGALGVG